jgi:hypothetical protein
MSHPSVVTLDHHSRPRVLFSGDQLVEVDLPPGTKVIYPKPPLAGLRDPDAAIREALNHPLGSAPLYAKLRPGMKVTVAIDDLSMPLPPMKTPDVRQRVLERILDLLDDHGVSDVHFIIATAFHRPMTAAEVERMVGRRLFNRFWPEKLYNHDAEKPDGLVLLGNTASGVPVEINRRAAESDLVVYVNLTFVPMNGGHKSLGTGLAGYRTIRAHHNPSTIRATASYMQPDTSELNRKMTEVGRFIEEKLDVFHVETTVNNRMFDAPLAFLAKNEDELTGVERLAMSALIKSLQTLPQPARQAIFDRVPAPYELTGVWAGACEPVHAEAVAKVHQQLVVPVEQQADIAIYPVPYISPYNVGAYLNPLLLSVQIEGYLHNLHRGAPLVKKGGTVIALHPATDKFDPEQHAPYVEFFHELLPKSRDAMTLHKEHEKKFAQNAGYIQMYRTGKGYHPVHPFYMWYWGENGRQHIGRVIIVGADNTWVPKVLGYETARTMEEALRMARETAPPDPEIACFRVCPLLMVEVAPPTRPALPAPAEAK